MHYHLLALDSNSVRMPLNILKKIEKLVKAGAMVTGPRPLGSPSLGDRDPSEYSRIVEELWGKDNNPAPTGNGGVYQASSLAEVLQAMHIQADFTYQNPGDGTSLLYVHRRWKGRICIG